MSGWDIFSSLCDDGSDLDYSGWDYCSGSNISSSCTISSGLIGQRDSDVSSGWYVYLSRTVSSGFDTSWSTWAPSVGWDSSSAWGCSSAWDDLTCDVPICDPSCPVPVPRDADVVTSATAADKTTAPARQPGVPARSATVTDGFASDEFDTPSVTSSHTFILEDLDVVEPRPSSPHTLTGVHDSP